MQQHFMKRIMRLLTHDDYTPVQPKGLARILPVPEGEYEIFRQELEQLAQEGRIVIGKKELVSLPEMAGEVTGIFQAARGGYGFIRPDNPTAQGDLYIPIGESLNAISGDKVVAKVSRQQRRDETARLTGRVSKIISRGRTQFVGTLLREGRGWFVQPDGKAPMEIITVSDPGAKDARGGDKVLVEILKFSSRDYHAEGVILERLGKSGTDETELKGILRRYKLENKFTRKVLQETRRVVGGFNAEKELSLGGREDIRSQTIITIDPADARDFDDAISLKRLAQGQWQLGVHIADVSHFVKKGKLLDEEAHKRATSVYLPRHVIPMLPELLSNGICSLQEGQDRLVKSVYIKLDSKGKVLGTRFANSVMRSKQRLTYEQVDEILEGKGSSLEKRVVGLIKKMAEVARKLQKRRQKQGMLTLELPKAELVFNDKGQVVDARPESTTFSHTMIEMFMLEANEAVARLLDSVQVEFLRRIHPEPNALTAGAMTRVIKLCGYVIPRDIDRIGLQKLLDSARGKPESFLINLAVLKSLQKAEYSPSPIGHYALASQFYCHFTSPIRRYPDLTVHRLLDEWIAGDLRKETAGKYPGYDELETLGAHCSERERNAEAAEMDLHDRKILQMLKQKVGEDTLAVVTSVTNFGVFVQLEKFLIEGRISAEDVLRFSPSKSKKGRRAKNAARNSRKGGRKKFQDNCPYKLGQEIKVNIAGVNMAAGTLDLVPANER